MSYCLKSSYAGEQMILITISKMERISDCLNLINVSDFESEEQSMKRITGMHPMVIKITQKEFKQLILLTVEIIILPVVNLISHVCFLYLTFA